MIIDFAKYQGTGNDFILIDDRAETFPLQNQALIAQLCHRRFGIGADGLILLRSDPSYDFRMVYINADGAEGSMCGNGGRCIVQFAHDLGLFEQETRFMAVDGEHTATIDWDTVSLKMMDVDTTGQRAEFTFLNTGSPHVVQFVEALDTLDVVTTGRPMRYSEALQPGGANINFVEPLVDNALFVRTYERGVEDETYSCGTGVTAAALVAHGQLGLTTPIAIQTLGGNLSVSFTPMPNGGFEQVYLQGPAIRVFTGSVTV